MIVGLVTAERGYIDDITLPRETRPRIIRVLAMLRNKHVENPKKKHGNIPKELVLRDLCKNQQS